MTGYIRSKITQWQSSGQEPEYESLSLADFTRELDYATLYLSRLLKVRPFVMYLLLFKLAYFTEGKRTIYVKLSELGKNLLSDFGKPMSHDVVKRGVNELVSLNIIVKTPSRPGQVNEYEIRLPSEIQAVQEMIKVEAGSVPDAVDNRFDDYYTDPQRRFDILSRDCYKCFYCLREVQSDTFYLDHLKPRTQGGKNYRCNLVSTCKTCNTKKNATDAAEFLRKNYRQDLITQDEFASQKQKLTTFLSEYDTLEKEAHEQSIARIRK